MIRGASVVHGHGGPGFWGLTASDIMLELASYHNAFSWDFPVSTRHEGHQGGLHRGSDIEVWLQRMSRSFPDGTFERTQDVLREPVV